MKSGDVIRIIGKVRACVDDKSWIEYRIEKDDALVVFALGLEPKTAEWDNDHWLAVMNAHGFIRTDQLTDEEWKVIKSRIEAKIKIAESKKEG